MADYGAIYTDKEIAKLDKEIRSIYKEAEKDINAKMKNFVAKSKAKEQKYQQKVASGQMTQKEFDRWKEGQVFQGKQWQAKKDEILETIHNSNVIATKMINGESINVFAANANYMSYDMEHGAGVNFGFSLYDSNTVTNLIKNDPQLLPQWKIDKPKDYKWSQKKLSRSITQGIIQGESLDKIANRLSDKLASTNANKMKTFARTAMTGAQNSGRQTQLENAKNLGIELMKEWMATLDPHTRDSHRDLDGEQVEVDKKFSNGLMFPGEPGGAPAEVYNCRCTMVSDIKKYPSTYNRYDNISGKQIKNMSYRDWEDAKKNSKDLSPVPLTFKHYKTDEQKALMDLFKNKSMSGLYKDMKDLDKTEANKFYKILGEAGKPSEVWQQYLDGDLSDATSKKIDDILNQYGLNSGIIAQPVDLKLTFANKNMSNVYNDMKAIDSKMANEFYKDLKGMGKPSEVWGKYLNGELSEAEIKKIEGSLDKYLNAQASVPTTVKDASQILGSQKPKDIKTLEDAQKALKSAEDAVKNVGADKEFAGIWKDPVTYADYEAKAASIQAKKDYYEAQILKYQGDAYLNSPWAVDEIKKMKDNLKQLEEFEKNGKAYSQLLKNVEDAKAKVKSLTPTPPALSQERKDAALWAKSSKEADNALRVKTGEVWQKATQKERDAIYEYTASYHKFNEPLRGIEYGSNAFKGVGKTDLNASYANNGERLNAMTKIIDKCSYDHDMWLQRGCRFSGMDKFLDIDMDKLRYGTEKDLQKELLGKTVTEYGFMSCGSSKGQGFSGDILFNVYAPSGTKMMYVEPFSAFGNGSGKSWDGKETQSSFGSELETILQQGTQFNITKVEKTKGQIYIDLEVINQLPPQVYKK